MISFLDDIVQFLVKTYTNLSRRNVPERQIADLPYLLQKTEGYAALNEKLGTMEANNGLSISLIEKEKRQEGFHVYPYKVGVDLTNQPIFRLVYEQIPIPEQTPESSGTKIIDYPKGNNQGPNNSAVVN